MLKLYSRLPGNVDFYQLTVLISLVLGRFVIMLVGQPHNGVTVDIGNSRRLASDVSIGTRRTRPEHHRAIPQGGAGSVS
jgi:hypothetical protein